MSPQCCYQLACPPTPYLSQIIIRTLGGGAGGGEGGGAKECMWNENVWKIEKTK